MTWTCPNCERRYPDSGIGIPQSAEADDMDACKVCWENPLTELVDRLAEDLGIERSEHVRETGRAVAHLRD